MDKAYTTHNYLKYLCLTAVIALLTAVTLMLCGCDDYSKPDCYTVMLPEGTGYTVLGDNVRSVKPNESVCFEVNIHDGYEFIASSVGEYSNGKLTIKKVEYSVTVDFTVRLSSDIASIENGTITITSDGGDLPEYGQPASFCIVPYENYVVEQVYVNGKIYDFAREPNGSVIITQTFDKFISVNAVCLGKECNIAVAPANFGTVNIKSQRTVIRYGDTVSVQAVPNENYILACLTVGDVQLYDEHSYTFTVSGDTYISARFISADVPRLTYDYGNGKIFDSDPIDGYNPGEFLYLQNGVGNWKYDGYTLESWNTKKDGSGKRHALGAMITMPSTDTVLYAQYKKQTSTDLFTFSEHTDHSGEIGYAITSFHDNSAAIDEVVLPDSYNGKKVFAVAAEAFRGADTVRSIVTNTNIEAIGDYAFAEMPDLTDLYLFDSLRELKDSALADTNLHRLHINSASKRIYDKILETNIVDKQMLVQTSARKKIVTLSGCSMAKGMNPELFADDEYLKDYDVINMGVHARYGLGFLMYMIENYLNDGDIVVFALENYEHLWFTENSMDLINTQQPYRLMHLESNYDIYEEFDFSQTRDTNDILSVLPQYFSDRANDMDSGLASVPNPSRDMMNKHGYYTYFRSSLSEPNKSLESPEYLLPQMEFLTGVHIINEWAQKLMARGVRFCFIFPPTYEHSEYDSEDNVLLREQFQSALAEQLIFPVIGSIDDVVMPFNCFYDHVYHPSTAGTPVYTEKFRRLLSGAIANGII